MLEHRADSSESVCVCVSKGKIKLNFQEIYSLARVFHVRVLRMFWHGHYSRLISISNAPVTQAIQVKCPLRQ